MRRHRSKIISLLPVWQTAAGLRRADQAVRHASPQFAVDSVGPPVVQRRRRKDWESRPSDGCWTPFTRNTRSTTGCFTFCIPRCGLLISSRAKGRPPYSIAELQPHLKDFEAEINGLEKVRPAEYEPLPEEAARFEQKAPISCRLLMASFTAPEIRPDHSGRSECGRLTRKDCGKASSPAVGPARIRQRQWQLFPIAWVRAYAARPWRNTESGDDLTGNDVLQLMQRKRRRFRPGRRKIPTGVGRQSAARLRYDQGQIRSLVQPF